MTKEFRVMVPVVTYVSRVDYAETADEAVNNVTRHLEYLSFETDNGPERGHIKVSAFNGEDTVTYEIYAEEA